MHEAGSEVKAEFALYNTFQFLNDDLTASIERISEHIALADSKVTQRFTSTLATNDILEVKRPMPTASLVDTFMSDEV